MKDDRSTKTKKVTAYSDAMIKYALNLGGIEEALKVRDDLRQVIFASMYNANILNMLSEGAYEAYNQTISNMDMEKFILATFKNARKPILDTLKIMAENNEVYLMASLTDKYDQLLEEMFNLIIVDVVTAVPLDDSLREKISKKVQNDLDAEILLDEHINKNVIGGFILIAKGRTLDMSVATLLNKTKNKLTSLHQEV